MNTNRRKYTIYHIRKEKKRGGGRSTSPTCLSHWVREKHYMEIDNVNIKFSRF